MSSSGIDNARAKDGAGRVRSTAGTFVSTTETTETTDRLQRDFESQLSIERVPLLVDVTDLAPPTRLESNVDEDDGDDSDELVIAPRLGQDELLDLVDEKPGKGTSELVSARRSSVDWYWEPSREYLLLFLSVGPALRVGSPCIEDTAWADVRGQTEVCAVGNKRTGMIKDRWDAKT